MQKQKNKMKKKGSTLMLVLAILITISSTSVIFVRICNKERICANNFIAEIDARLTAYAGLDHALAVTFNQLMQGEILQKSASLAKNFVHDRFSCSGFTGQKKQGNYSGRYELNGNFYALQIDISAAKLNINSYIAEKPSDQKTSNNVLYRILLSLATRCGIKEADHVVSQIVQKPIIDQKRFSSFISLQNFILSFKEDKKALTQFLDNLSVHSQRNKMVAVAEQTIPALYDMANLYRELRTPIDINNVSFELLCSIIQNIKGTYTFYDTKGNSESSFYENNNNVFMDAAPKHVTVNFLDENIQIEQMAQSIQERIKLHGPFYSFTELSIFIDTNFVGCYPEAPEGIHQEKWIRAWQDTLKSNFNCDVVENNWTPSKPSYFSVSKTSLFGVNRDNTCTPGHTTELCFFNLGPVTIESRGYITANNGALIVAKSQIKVSVEWGKVITQASQQDYSSGVFNNTVLVSSPNINEQKEHHFLGGIEPKAKNGEIFHFNNISDLETPCYYLSSSYQNYFVIPEPIVLGPLYWVGYSSNNLPNVDYIKKSNIMIKVPNLREGYLPEIIIPEKTIIKNKGEVIYYQATFSIGEYTNYTEECPTLGSVSQTLLFCYPRLSNVLVK